MTRLIDMGIPPYLVASSLELVVAQRLIRVNCQSCATRYEPGADVVESLGLRPATSLVNSRSLREAGPAAAAEGRTTYSEALRVTTPTPTGSSEQALAT